MKIGFFYDMNGRKAWKISFSPIFYMFCLRAQVGKT